jgi:predicted amidohydrolase YtcJ
MMHRLRWSPGQSCRRPASAFCLSLVAILLVGGTHAASAAGPGWRAGLARVSIMPADPVWLAGYGGQARVPTGRLHELWAKALALEAPDGGRAVLIASDFQGVPRSMSDRVFARLEAEHGLGRDRVMFTFSHNHCAPRLGDDLLDYYPEDPEQERIVTRYTAAMVDRCVELVGRALADLGPADLRTGAGRAGFAVNRRENAEASVAERTAHGPPLVGPTDHAVPVMTVTRPDGRLAAILFGYACHPTTLKITAYNGDYPGFAQAFLERSHPGTMALFVNTCGGDQNPLPRRSVELCERYGLMLAAAVEETLRQPLEPVAPTLRVGFERIELPYERVATARDLEIAASDTNATKARWARRMQRRLGAGERFDTACPYPLHAWRLGADVLFIGMGGETVVDYALRFKSIWGPRTWVLGYTDDMVAYVPSRRVWEEGGYEGGDRIYEYGNPAFRWAGDVEDRIVAAVTRLVEATGAGAPEPRTAGAADFVLTGGRVVTLDDADTIASAVAIRGGRIVHVGDDAAALALAGPETLRFDAAGRTVIPGLHESHVHVVLAAKTEAVQPFRQLRSIADVRGWVRQRAAELPADEWVILPRIEVTRMLERRLPDRADLDAAAPDRPVALVWQYANRHVQVLNTAALAAAGITPDTVAPAGGRIAVGPDNALTGRLENCAPLTARWINRPPAERRAWVDRMAELVQAYGRFGITSIVERKTDVEGWQAFRELREAGRLPVRTAVTIAINSDGTVAGVERFIRGLPFRPREGDEHLRVGPLKMAVDGGVLYGTAYLREPYGPQAFGLYGIDDPRYRGLLQMSAEQVRDTVRTAHRLGWPLCAHVTGDAGVDIVLDAVEAADRDAPIADRRFTLLHAYFPSPDTAARCRRLGVCIDTQPAWYYKDGDALAEALGGARLSQFIGLRIWRDAGLPVAINADHIMGFDGDSALNPFNPFLTMAVAVTRRTEAGRVFGPDQRVSRVEALRMMTVWPAWITGEEGEKGTLEVGRLGDLAVLSDDLLACPEERIPAIRSVLTVVGGRVTHRAGPPAGTPPDPCTKTRAAAPAE